MNTRLLALTAFALGSFFIAASSHAEEFIISGNGAGSDNSINFQSSSETSINQQNQMDVNNEVDANANTGGNDTDHGSVETGDASVFVKIMNFFNNNSADVDNCCPDGQPTPTPTGFVPGQPTPTTAPGIGGPGTSNGGGGNGGGGVGGPSADGEVMGLSAASGDGVIEQIFTTLGVLCLALGSALMRVKKIFA